MIERRITIGLIVSTEFIQQIHPIWDAQLLESQMAKLLTSWCMEYYEKYDKAPGKDIEGIYFQKLKAGLSKDLAEEIEEDILPDLNDEYEREKFNVSYLLDQTREYLTERHLITVSEEVKALAQEGDLTAAELLASSYTALARETGNHVDLNSDEVLNRIDKAFEEADQPIVSFPKQLGEFWNHQLVRDGFVAFMAPEKRGKTFWLLELAIKGVMQKAKVVFFQAGDMSEGQQLIRLCIHLTKRSNREKYCKPMYQPVRDCLFNQINTCDRKERECDFGIFDDMDVKELLKIPMEELIQTFKDEPDYKACHNCSKYKGVPWLQKIPKVDPLTAKEAKEKTKQFFAKYKGQFRLSTYSNDSLTVREIKAQLDLWEKRDNFVPDMIIIDYADLLIPDTTEFRHGQNEIWKALRGLSQERHCLLITATQADAASYEKDSLRMKNFSEDKRKYSHVTAMYGLNQDVAGREKEIGLMRINEIVVREGKFDGTKQITVLHRLERGRPFLGSYW